jgi:hypothetical protein
VPPLVAYLPCGAVNPVDRSNRSNLLTIEGVTARLGFDKNRIEIGIDCGFREGMRLEPKQLRMMAIALGLAPKDCASQKRFAPQSDQALRIQIFGVERPDAHVGSIPLLPC